MQLAAHEGLSSATYMCAARAALDAADEVREVPDALLLEQRLLVAGDKVRAAHQLVDRELMHTKKKADLKERMLQEKERVEGAKETFLLAKQRLAAAWAMAEVEANAGHLFEPAAAEAALETAAVALERAEASILALPETGDAEGMVALIGVAMREVEVAETAVEREKRRLLVWQRRTAAEERRKAAHATKVRPALLEYIKKCEDDRAGGNAGDLLLTDGDTQDVYGLLSDREAQVAPRPPAAAPAGTRVGATKRKVHVNRSGSIDISMDSAAAAKIAAMVGSGGGDASSSRRTANRLAGGALSSGRGVASDSVSRDARRAAPRETRRSQRSAAPAKRSLDVPELSIWSPEQIQGALASVPRADLLREFGRADEKRHGCVVRLPRYHSHTRARAPSRSPPPPLSLSLLSSRP